MATAAEKRIRQIDEDLQHFLKESSEQSFLEHLSKELLDELTRLNEDARRFNVRLEARLDETEHLFHRSWDSSTT